MAHRGHHAHESGNLARKQFDGSNQIGNRVVRQDVAADRTVFRHAGGIVHRVHRLVARIEQDAVHAHLELLDVLYVEVEGAELEPAVRAMMVVIAVVPAAVPAGTGMIEVGKKARDIGLHPGRNLAAGNCNGVGEPVVSVTQGIQNTVDSGEAGNYWAFDDFNRTIQLWRTSEEGTYCAVVKYTGNFKGAEGETSPGNTGVLEGRERGPIQGGYLAVIAGTLLDEPLWKTRGSVGVVDYACDLDGNCPGAINWVTQYFENDYVFQYNWWGWIYRAGGNKTWVNSSNGNSGDVI